MKIGIRFRLGLALLFTATILITVSSSLDADDLTWVGGDDVWVDGGGSGLWSPKQEPGPSDNAFFDSLNQIDIQSDNEVNGVGILQGGLVNEEFTLTANSVALSTLTTGGPSQLVLGRSSGSTPQFGLKSGETALFGSSELFLRRTGILIEDFDGDPGFLATDSAARIEGVGVIESASVLKLGPFTYFNNNGELEVVAANPAVNSGSLIVSANSDDGRVDLDGDNASESGKVFIRQNQLLEIQSPLSDAFNGAMTFGDSSRLDMDNSWTLSAGSTVDLESNANATVSGATLSQNGGSINVSGSTGNADKTLTFQARYIGTGGSLNNSTGGTVVFSGANSTLSGTLDYQLGAEAETVVDGVFVTIGNGTNLEGSDGDTKWTVQNGGTLVIDQATTTTDSAWDGQVTLNNSTLDVNVNAAAGWTSDGSVISIGNSQIQGDSLTLGDGTGFGAELGQLNVSSGGTLTIDVPTLTLANDGSVSLGFDSTLALQTQNAVDVAGRFVLSRATMTGATLDFADEQNGIFGSGLVQNQILSGSENGFIASGGELILDNPLSVFNPVVRFNSTGTDGLLTIRGQQSTVVLDGFGAVQSGVNVRGRGVTIEDVGLTLGTTSSSRLEGGTLTAGQDIEVEGSLLVVGAGTMVPGSLGQIVFTDTGNVETRRDSQSVVAGDGVLELAGDAFIESNATFTADDPSVIGTLLVSAGTTVAEGQNSFGIGVDNRSQFNLGVEQEIAADIVVADYAQTADGTLVWNAFAPDAGDHDQLTVLGDAGLAGDFDVSTFDGSYLSYQTVSAISVDGTMTGTFGTVTGVRDTSKFGDAEGLAVTYGSDSVNVTRALLGDANLDQIVNVLDDAAILIQNLGTQAGGTWAQGDFNGDGAINVLGDAALLVSNINTQGGNAVSPSAVSVPEPGSLTLLTLATVFVASNRRRHF